MNMKMFLLTVAMMIVASLFLSAPLDAQTELNFTRQQFVDTQLQMLENIDQAASEAQSARDEILKKNLPPEEYQRLKQEDARLANEEQIAAAKCLGIEIDEIGEIEEKVGPKFQIEVVKACASLLPDSFTLSGVDFASAPALAEYSNCTVERTAKELGFPLEKFAQCNGVTTAE